jgi:hypothetical protein
MKRSSQRTVTVADHAAPGQVGTAHRLPRSRAKELFIVFGFLIEEVDAKRLFSD